MLYGSRLKELRMQRGYTQEELADLLGVHPRQIHRYEANDVDPSSTVVSRIATTFGVTSDYLLGLTDDPVGRIAEADLSANERRLIFALRSGLLQEALETMTAIGKDARAEK